MPPSHSYASSDEQLREDEDHTKCLEGSGSSIISVVLLTCLKTATKILKLIHKAKLSLTMQIQLLSTNLG